MTPQRHRYTGAVGSRLNYPQTEYGAPTVRAYGTPFVTKLEIAYGHHVSLHGHHVSLHGDHVSLHGHRVSLRGHRVR